MKVTKNEIINSEKIKEIKNGVIVNVTEGFLVIKDGDVYFLQNIETKKTFGPFLYTCGFSEGYAIVKDVSILKTDHWIIMDKNGIGKADFIAKGCGDIYFSDGYAAIGNKTFVNLEGKIIEYKPNDKKVLYVSTFKNGRAVVCYETKFGKEKYYYIDKNFNRVSKNNYDIAIEYNDDRAVAGKKYIRFILDKNENILLKIDLEKDNMRIASRYRDGLLSYAQNGRWGCFDRECNDVIDPFFEYDLTFSDNVAVYHNNDDGAYYIVNKRGTMKPLLTKEQRKPYCDITYFKKGYALLPYKKLNPSADIIDKEGNITVFDENLKICDEYLVLGSGKKYIHLDDIKDLKKEYQIIIEKDGKEIIKSFEEEEDRDNYYDLLLAAQAVALEESNNLYNERVDKLFEDADKIYSEKYSRKVKTSTKKNN